MNVRRQALRKTVSTLEALDARIVPASISFSPAGHAMGMVHILRVHGHPLTTAHAHHTAPAAAHHTARVPHRFAASAQAFAAVQVAPAYPSGPAAAFPTTGAQAQTQPVAAVGTSSSAFSASVASPVVASSSPAVPTASASSSSSSGTTAASTPAAGPTLNAASTTTGTGTTTGSGATSTGTTGTGTTATGTTTGSGTTSTGTGGSSAAATTTTTTGTTLPSTDQSLSNLYQEYQQYAHAGGQGTFSPPEASYLMIRGTDVGVDFRAAGSANFNAALTGLTNLGMQVTASDANSGTIEGMLPISQLAAAAQLPSNGGMTAVYKPTLR